MFMNFFLYGKKFAVLCNVYFVYVCICTNIVYINIYIYKISLFIDFILINLVQKETSKER